MEGVLSQISNLEKSVNKIQVSIVSFNEKVMKMDETIQDFACFGKCRHRGNAELEETNFRED